MLTFFRKIRKALIDSSSTRKYLLYAVGEIALVVLGILIALQINNWNEHRKSIKLEQSYYCKLMEDIIQDSIQIERLITQTEERIRYANQLLHLLQQQDFERSEVLKVVMGSLSLITSTFVPSQAAFEDLKSSGNLNILREDQLKSNLISYYQTLNGLVDVADYHANEAVRRLYQKDDFAAVGWHEMTFVKEGLDTTIVDVNLLKTHEWSRETFRIVIRSDGLLFLGANSRIKAMYETIMNEISRMKDDLEKICVNRSKGISI